jgi:hypothetical protein
MPVAGIRPAPLVDTVRVAISGTNKSLPWTNVFHLFVTTDGTKTAADLKTIVDSFVAAMFARMKATTSSDCVIVSAQATWITSAGNAIEYAGSYADTGLGGGAVGDASAAAVLNWSISSFYRGGHPRTYLAGVVAGNTDGASQLTNVYLAAIATAANLWLSDVNALTTAHILTVRFGTVAMQLHNAWLVTPVFKAFNAASTRKIFGTQRRRLGGR